MSDRPEDKFEQVDPSANQSALNPTDYQSGQMRVSDAGAKLPDVGIVSGGDVSGQSYSRKGIDAQLAAGDAALASGDHVAMRAALDRNTSSVPEVQKFIAGVTQKLELLKQHV